MPQVSAMKTQAGLLKCYHLIVERLHARVRHVLVRQGHSPRLAGGRQHHHSPESLARVFDAAFGNTCRRIHMSRHLAQRDALADLLPDASTRCRCRADEALSLARESGRPAAVLAAATH